MKMKRLPMREMINKCRDRSQHLALMGEMNVPELGGNVGRWQAALQSVLKLWLTLKVSKQRQGARMKMFFSLNLVINSCLDGVCSPASCSSRGPMFTPVGVAIFPCVEMKTEQDERSSSLDLQFLSFHLKSK